MSQPAIKIDGLGKRYKLGVTHAGSVRNLINGFAGRLASRSNDHDQNDAQQPLDPSRLDDDGHFWALKDVSFEVQPGEVVGIIGKNGAGKSTLLKLLSRITTPTTGEIQLRGRVASLLEVGTGFHPELTGRENVYLNGTILGMTKREVDRQFDAILDFAGIEKFIDTPVKRYSSGMTVRLGFAVAAHLDPEILIVDEVLAVGDVEFQRRCLGKMEEAAESGKTVLFVSHNLSSIRTLTSRAILLSTGELVFDGPTSDALHFYVSESVEQYGSSRVVELERPFGGLSRDLEFLELSLDVDGRPEFLLGETLPFKMTVRAKAHTGSFAIGMTIFRDDYLAVGSTFSQDLPAIQPGQTQGLRFVLPTPSLATGRYHCGISLTEARSSGRRVFDSLTNVLPFSIIPNALDSRGWTRGWGAVRFADLEISSRRQSAHSTSGPFAIASHENSLP